MCIDSRLCEIGASSQRQTALKLKSGENSAYLVHMLVSNLYAVEPNGISQNGQSSIGAPKVQTAHAERNPVCKVLRAAEIPRRRVM